MFCLDASHAPICADGQSVLLNFEQPDAPDIARIDESESCSWPRWASLLVDRRSRLCERDNIRPRAAGQVRLPMLD